MFDVTYEAENVILNVQWWLEDNSCLAHIFHLFSWSCTGSSSKSTKGQIQAIIYKSSHIKNEFLSSTAIENFGIFPLGSRVVGGCQILGRHPLSQSRKFLKILEWHNYWQLQILGGGGTCPLPLLFLRPCVVIVAGVAAASNLEKRIVQKLCCWHGSDGVSSS